MKNRKLVYIWVEIIIVVGVLSLLGTYLRLENLDVPFQELPRSFKAAILLSIALMGILTSVSLLSAALLLFRIEWVSALIERLIVYLERPRIKIVVIALLVITSIISGQILLQSNTSDNILGELFVDTTEVFFIWIFLTAFLSLGLLLADKDYLKGFLNPDNFHPFMLAVSILAVIVLLDISKYGFNKAANQYIEGDFRLTGFPILDYQVFLSWVGVVGGYFFLRWIVNKWGKKFKISTIVVDIIIVFSLFIGSFLISNSTPVLPNAFIDRPRPPNYTITPNLDSEIYERTAQSLLATGKMQTYIGEGDYLTIARRPFFTGFLALLHGVGGLGYEDILPLLLLSFSIIPVLVYLFTKTLHNRISGIIAALLIIFRHQTGLILAGDVWGGNNLHMLMSDFPAMIIAIIFLTLFVLWIKNPQERSSLPLIIGGVLGLGMLIRQEVAFLLPMASLVAVIKLKDRLRLLISQLFLIFIGMVIVITPWISRNWVNTGKLYLDKPGNRVERIISTFSKKSDVSTNDNQTGNSETNIVEVLTDTPPPVEAPQTHELLINHYANSIPQLFVYLPSNPLMLNFDFMWKIVNGELKEYYDGVLYSPYKYSKSLPYWWFDQWDGKIDPKSWIYLSGMVGLISLGIYRVWKKERWITLVPLLATFGMISLYAINRESGGRWLQTVDWISAMFLSIGLVEITFRALDYWRGIGKEPHTIPGSRIVEKEYVFKPNNTILALIFLGVVLLGSLPVIAEILLPNQYSEKEMELQLRSLLDEMDPTLNIEDRGFLLNFLDQGGEVIYGRALYPRYFPPDAEMMTTNQRLFPSSTTFTIAGTELNFIVLQQLAPPDWFPHGVDVLVVGCRESSLLYAPGFRCLGCQTDEFEALAIVQLNPDGQAEDILWRDIDQDIEATCPLVER